MSDLRHLILPSVQVSVRDSDALVYNYRSLILLACLKIL